LASLAKKIKKRSLRADQRSALIKMFILVVRTFFGVSSEWGRGGGVMEYHLYLNDNTIDIAGVTMLFIIFYYLSLFP